MRSESVRKAMRRMRPVDSTYPAPRRDASQADSHYTKLSGGVTRAIAREHIQAVLNSSVRVSIVLMTLSQAGAPVFR